MNNPVSPQQVEIPAISVPYSGLKAEYHIIRHQKKLRDCPFDAGMDLFPSQVDKVTHHGSSAVIWVHTFLTSHIGPGFCGEILPRSSSIDKLNGGEVLHGLIDAGYTGELMIRVRCSNMASVINLVQNSIVECATGQIAIAQLRIMPCFVMVPTVMPLNGGLPGVPSLNGTPGRGNRGFGSTDAIN